MTFRYGSVCSGIEAWSLAVHDFGWEAAFFSEIAEFPRRVLAQRWPHVPLHGDFTTIQDGDYAPIDLLVGGTPCQSFSIAGLRGGLEDERGNLSLEYCRLAQRLRPRWLVWENVPGVLSIDGGRAFGSILGAMGQLGYGLAYRVLDAQYFGVPQRRRRVYVVGYFGDWRVAAKVLFEPESLRGDPPPRRETGQDVAGTVSARPSGGGGLGTDLDLDGGLVAGTLQANGKAAGSATQQDAENGLLVPMAFGGNRSSGPIDISPALNGHGSGSRRMDFESEALIVPQTVYSIQAGALRENADAGPDGAGFKRDVAYTLEARSEVQAIAFDCKASGRNGFGIGEVSPTLRAMGHADTHQNAGGQVAVMLPAEGGGPATDYAVRRLTPLECERLQGIPDGHTRIVSRHYRRPKITPLRPADMWEPDAETGGWCLMAADGPRYKAISNSKAVPVVRWLAGRIKAFEEGRL